MVDIYFLCRCHILDWRLYEHIGGNINMNENLTTIERIVIIAGLIVLVYIVGGHYE